MNIWLRNTALYVMNLLFGVGGLLLLTRGGEGINQHGMVGVGLMIALVVLETVAGYLSWKYPRKIQRKVARVAVTLIVTNIALVAGVVLVIVLDHIYNLNTTDAWMGAGGSVLLIGGGILFSFLNRERGD